MENIQVMLNKNNQLVDVWFLALREVNTNELNYLLQQPDIKLNKIKNVKKSLSIYSKKVKNLKLESSKYDYYNVTGKNYFYNIRIIK